MIHLKPMAGTDGRMDRQTDRRTDGRTGRPTIGSSIWVSVCLSVVLAACAPNNPALTATVFPDTPTPQVARTVVSAPTDTPMPAPGPSSTVEPIVTLVPTLGGPCSNDAEFISDMTVPDGAQFLPGQTFIKKWRVLNNGTCDWGPDFAVVLTEGEAMGASGEAALYPARAGTEGIWEVELRAPDVPGLYRGRWQAQAPDGTRFGQVVFVQIEVIALPVTDTPSP